jgi:hypothetical protein
MCPKDTALFWLSQGVASVPLCYRSKAPAGKSLIKSGLWQIKEGEIKGHWTPLKTKLPTEKMIDIWFEDTRPYNLALVTGWSNICVLDFDAPESWACWYVWQLEYQPEILDSYRVQSSRGIHAYYYLSEPAKLNSIQGALYEIKTGGKLVTTPPSVHESGRVYTSLDDPNNIKRVTPEQILNYSPLYLAPVVYPLAKRSKFAPQVDYGSNDLLPEILKIPLLQFFDGAEKMDDRFYRTHCPFHGHKNNFWIDTQLNICGCYAGCIGKPSYDVIAFYSQLNDISNSDAIKELKRLL